MRPLWTICAACETVHVRESLEDIYATLLLRHPSEIGVLRLTDGSTATVYSCLCAHCAPRSTGTTESTTTDGVTVAEASVWPLHHGGWRLDGGDYHPRKLSGVSTL